MLGVRFSMLFIGKEEGSVQKILLGCIADDFTGASDAASYLQKGGLNPILTNGIGSEVPSDVNAIVVALKTRTMEREAAVAETLAALEWLQEKGADKIYLKYCSTFDSTKDGNIGPAVDAVMERLEVDVTVLCPSLPENGRTVVDGNLYVQGIPLDQTHMRHHPLTPMWSSQISELMQEQGKYRCQIIRREEFATFSEEKQNGKRYYVPDFETEEDGQWIGEHFGSLPLLTGGSGLLEPLAASLAANNKQGEVADLSCASEGKALILAGSCSDMTLRQIEYFLERGGRGYRVIPEKVANGEQTLDHATAFLEKQGDIPVIVYSSEPKNVRKEFPAEVGIAERLENFLAETAKWAREHKYTRFLVAGGETSGAVTQALGYSEFRVGPPVAPGVPVLIPLSDERIRLVLKSGNFGAEDFFQKALEMTGKERLWTSSY